MLNKNYIVSQLKDSLSPKFIRQQKYLRKTEHRFFDKNRIKRIRPSKSFNIDDYFKRPQGLKQL